MGKTAAPLIVETGYLDVLLADRHSRDRLYLKMLKTHRR